MNHNVRLEQFRVSIRPVTMNDAEFIHQLRLDSSLSKYIGHVDSQLSVHKCWIQNYFLRSGDYYFCIELPNGKPVGTIGLYNVSAKEAEWGRWVVSPSIPAAPASAWLIYHLAFDHLELSSVFCRTVADNKHVVSFHDHCGMQRDGIERNGLILNGVAHDLIIHRTVREQWPAIQQKLKNSATVAVRLINELILHDT